MTYAAADGLPQELVAKAEELRARIIDHMQKQMAEQIGAGVNHPYASGKFDIVEFKESSTYVAQLNFYPSLPGSGGFADKAKVVDKGKSEIDVVDALQALLHYVDPTRREYRDKRW